MPIIQKVYVIFDLIYDSIESIPAEAFDTFKEIPKVRYIVAEDFVSTADELETGRTNTYKTYEEAERIRLEEETLLDDV
ncbi:hypothetical protein GLW08_20405 [Pontibacillus yanchengensis]|uniref:Uncharacterized protein n=2 Tax=Pontibacillus yanchengensis TaxID=462910 RepID=A0ACC7VLJ6_9BACI|nr:hypothetical protein [Pontibacillus yanchengensis]MYL35467.1 hypothetical protein [Pontibacillus yanchengensis]MYL55667.1 hypothetical protein [Pontibacillus yanchengensis]